MYPATFDDKEKTGLKLDDCFNPKGCFIVCC